MTVDEAMTEVREAPTATERELLMVAEILALRTKNGIAMNARADAVDEYSRVLTRVRLLETRLGMIGDALNYREPR